MMTGSKGSETGDDRMYAPLNATLRHNPQTPTAHTRASGQKSTELLRDKKLTLRTDYPPNQLGL